MHILSVLLLAASLSGEEAKPTLSPALRPSTPGLTPYARPLTPQLMLRAMLAQERTRKDAPGATVEVIGYDDEAQLKLLALKVATKVRLEFRKTDLQQHRELYAFMQQNPSRPAQMLFIP